MKRTFKFNVFLALNVITEITAVMRSIIQGIFGNPGKAYDVRWIYSGDY